MIISMLFFIIPILIPILLIVGSVWILYDRSLHSNSRLVFYLLPVLAAIILFVVYFFLFIVDYTGILIMIFTISLNVFLLFGIIFALISVIRRRKEMGHHRLILFSVGMILLVGLGFFSQTATFLMTEKCEQIHLQSGDKIIQAIEEYRQKYGKYPDNLMDVFPTHITKNEVFTCYQLQPDSGNKSPDREAYFYYKKCHKGTTQLSIPYMGTTTFHLYDFKTKNWMNSTGDWLEQFDRITRCQEGQ
jgi:hypothetical protein